MLRLLLKSGNHEASDCRLFFFVSAEATKVETSHRRSSVCQSFRHLLGSLLDVELAIENAHPPRFSVLAGDGWKTLLLPVSFGQIWRRSSFLHVLQHAQGEQPGAPGLRRTKCCCNVGFQRIVVNGFFTVGYGSDLLHYEIALIFR